MKTGNLNLGFKNHVKFCAKLSSYLLTSYFSEPRIEASVCKYCSCLAYMLSEPLKYVQSE